MTKGETMKTIAKITISPLEPTMKIDRRRRFIFMVPKCRLKAA
jgi:hypothetical protein